MNKKLLLVLLVEALLIGCTNEQATQNAATIADPNAAAEQAPSTGRDMTFDDLSQEEKDVISNACLRLKYGSSVGAWQDCHQGQINEAIHGRKVPYDYRPEN